MIDTTSPSERKRELGTQLRELRSQRGHTVEDVAEDLLWSTTKVGQIEIDARCPSLLDVRDFARATAETGRQELNSWHLPAMLVSEAGGLNTVISTLIRSQV